MIPKSKPKTAGFRMQGVFGGSGGGGGRRGDDYGDDGVEGEDE
jgi:hypothetical protein